MSASAVSARQGRDAPMRLGANPPVSFHVLAHAEPWTPPPADAVPKGRRPAFLVSAGLADATARVHLSGTPSSGNGREPSRPAELGFPAALDEGPEASPQTDQRQGGDGRQLGYVPGRLRAPAGADSGGHFGVSGMAPGGRPVVKPWLPVPGSDQSCGAVRWNGTRGAFMRQTAAPAPRSRPE